jgi:hypothetical protein
LGSALEQLEARDLPTAPTLLDGSIGANLARGGVSNFGEIADNS